MTSLLGTLQSALSGQTLDQLSGALGADPDTTRNAAMTALPLMLGAMNRNTSTPTGAQSLDMALKRDHDGSLLDGLGGFLGALQGRGAAAGGAGGLMGGLAGALAGGSKATDGGGILGHVFGNRLPHVESGLAKSTGLSQQQVLQLLMTLAPVVMSALGKMKRERDLDAGGVSDVLSHEAARAREAAPSGILGQLGQLLDRDGDGNPLDDLAGLAGGLLGGRR